MTHNEWEKGKSLTIHNATKDQLKAMIRDRDEKIARLTGVLEEKERMIQFLINFKLHDGCEETEA